MLHPGTNFDTWRRRPLTNRPGSQKAISKNRFTQSSRQLQQILHQGLTFAWVGKRDGHAALKQFSQVPYFELKLPPPLCCACSEITARAQTSQVLAIWPSDIGCERLRRDMLNLDFAFTERSSYSLLSKQRISDPIFYIRCNGFPNFKYPCWYYEWQIFSLQLWG
jgi:hypothetical protein